MYSSRIDPARLTGSFLNLELRAAVTKCQGANGSDLMQALLHGIDHAFMDEIFSSAVIPRGRCRTRRFLEYLFFEGMKTVGTLGVSLQKKESSFSEFQC